MEMLWFWLVSVMVAIYAVLDGFDFGAGVLHLFVAKSDTERREVLGAIGPFWDGNEVWLLAGGGALFLAFPKVLAAGFSGFRGVNDVAILRQAAERVPGLRELRD